MTSCMTTPRQQHHTFFKPLLLLLMMVVGCSGGPQETVTSDILYPTMNFSDEASLKTKLKTTSAPKTKFMVIPSNTYHIKLDGGTLGPKINSERSTTSLRSENVHIIKDSDLSSTERIGTIYLRHPRKQISKYQNKNPALTPTSVELSINDFDNALNAKTPTRGKPWESGNHHALLFPATSVNNIQLLKRSSARIRSSRNAYDDSRAHVLQPKALPVEISQDEETSNSTELPSKGTTPSIESLLPSKIIPSLPPHLRDLTTTTPMPAIFFNNSFISNVTAQLGQSVFLPCRTRHSSDRKFIPQVSWVRRRDWHILTSGTVTYTKEQRYDVHHPEGSTEWTLVIKYVRQEDAGTYECQLTSGEGLISHLVHLSIVVPKAVIPGNGEYHIDTGSTISLTCYVDQSPITPRYIFWYHNSRMINYDRERGGIKVEIESKPRVLSRLTITNARTADSGNYTCDADNTESDSITVYITEGNKIAAIQPRAVDGGNVSTLSLGVLLLVLSIHCLLDRLLLAGSLENMANTILLDLLDSRLLPLSKRSRRVLLASEGLREDSQCASEPPRHSVFNGAFTISLNADGKERDGVLT